MGNTFFAVARLSAGLVIAAALAGCAGGTNYTQSGAVPSAGMAPSAYLDGTGPSAEQPRAARRVARNPQPEAVTTTAQSARAQDISASQTTSGSRQGTKPSSTAYSDEWWDKERREDARLKSKMSICRGC